MSTLTGTLDNGVDQSSGYGLWVRASASGSWSAGDTFSCSLTAGAYSYTIGAGRLTGVVPSFCMGLNDKLYFVSEDTLFFSSIQDATRYEQQYATAGFVQISSSYRGADALVALSPYQSGLAIFSRRTIQIWNVDPDPANYSKRQVLDNIGTVAALSVQSVGDLDTYFLADSGVRSLHVRDASNNGVITDIGTPIDGVLQSVLGGLTDEEKSIACAVIEPSSNRYWLHLDGTIYVLSYFMSSGVAAWSTYLPTYNDGTAQVGFFPMKFVVVNGLVYCLAADGKIFVYGGENGSSYDDAIPSWKTPYLSARSPATRKQATGVDAALEGAWTVSVGMDPVSDETQEVVSMDASTFTLGTFGLSQNGSHFCLEGVGRGSGYARFAMAILHFEGGDAS